MAKPSASCNLRVPIEVGGGGLGPEREEVWEDVIQYLSYEKKACVQHRESIPFPALCPPHTEEREAGVNGPEGAKKNHPHCDGGMEGHKNDQRKEIRLFTIKQSRDHNPIVVFENGTVAGGIDSHH